MFRTITFIARTLRTIDSWPDNVRDIVKLNLQSLQNNQATAFSDLPDWGNQGKVTDKPLKGKVKGTYQLTIKDRDSYRVVYVAQYNDKVFVLHAFKKKMEGADKAAIVTIDGRWKQLKADRKAKRI
jgi:phage-related protein